jgi:hypothetical protein
MKTNICFIFLLAVFATINLKAQSKNSINSSKIDTIYYLVDTIKTPEKERMWNVCVESNTKCFEIECPCLQYDSKPTFTYRLSSPEQDINENQLEKITTVGITTLINIAKGDIGKLHTYPRIIFIEKQDKMYVMHRVYLQEPRKPSVIIDSITIPGKPK